MSRAAYSEATFAVTDCEFAFANGKALCPRDNLVVGFYGKSRDGDDSINVESVEFENSNRPVPKYIRRLVEAWASQDIANKNSRVVAKFHDALVYGG